MKTTTRGVHGTIHQILKTLLLNDLNNTEKDNRMTHMYCTTVAPKLSDIDLSENLIYPTLCSEPPTTPTSCVQSTLIYLTVHPACEEQSRSDKPVLPIFTYVCIYIYISTYVRMYIYVCTYIRIKPVLTLRAVDSRFNVLPWNI